MQVSTFLTIASMLATGVFADYTCHVSLRNQKQQTGCFTFGHDSFKRNSVFPLGGGCSLQASPEASTTNPCAGLVNKLTSTCGTGRDITFATGPCP